MNPATQAEVDEALATAVAAGATLLKPAQKVEWGGYSGYFADPDGHAREVAYHPFWPLNEAGLPELSGAVRGQVDQPTYADGCRCGDTQ
ncbi:hypothetical protein Cme02nite_63420 [Catellatospora methionotrophica]|uniref:VOC domain-containing protein n=1 Tax=Catellatospora methionotrophica TaxID=121620 RepID=A0A8J3LNU6_9ACTN|nr:VOC family protein [Catellatospora methionotrophica]GIG18010.1 hypothetical protein Cme02nite_63420 [Catellatospora methionotrophica]